MEKNKIDFRSLPLFYGIEESAYRQVFSCLQAEEKTYRKGERLLSPGDFSRRFGLVCSGAVQICREDPDGNQTLLSQLLPGNLFAEAFACAGRPLTVAAETSEQSVILWMNPEHLFSFGERSCPVHAQVAGNLLRILAQKNIFLTGRIQHLSCRSLREKVWSFLSEQALLAKSNTFTISFNRQQMADYLAADRSALSAVLCRMQKEGSIRFQKNRFTLL